jgi:hypothetical protein
LWAVSEAGSRHIYDYPFGHALDIAAGAEGPAGAGSTIPCTAGSPAGRRQLVDATLP